VFNVKVNEVKQIRIPEIGKEFFEDLGMEGIDSKESLEKTIEENIIAQKEVEVENKYIDDLLEAAAKECEVEIPEVMIEDELDRMVKQYEENLKMQGLTLEHLYQLTNSDEAALKQQMKEEATKRVKYRLMLEEIAKKEKIEVSDKEADEEADKLAEKYQMSKEEFLNMFGGLEMIKYDKKMRQAIELVKGE
jgi:trigger factor